MTLFWVGRRQGAGDPYFLAVIFRIPTDRINWTTSSFLIGTFFLTLTAVPLYLWYFGIDWFHVAVSAVLLAATGFSITLGYHRLFSHMVQVHYVGTGDNIMVDRVILDED